jgi:hypothetical protein
VGIGDDQLHSEQAAGDQPAQKRQPPRTVLGRGDIQAEDLPVPIGVDPGGDQGVHACHPAFFADLDRERVDPHEGVRPGIQRTLAKRRDLAIEVCCHLAELRTRQRLDPQLLS